MANANEMTVFEIGGERRRRCCCAQLELFALLLVLYCRLLGLLRSLPWSVLPNETTAREEREIERDRETEKQRKQRITKTGSGWTGSVQIRSDQIGSDWIPLKKVVDGNPFSLLSSSFALYISRKRVATPLLPGHYFGFLWCRWCNGKMQNRSILGGENFGAELTDSCCYCYE